MAKLPRRRTRRLALAAALASAIAVLSAPAGADEVGRDAVDLIGTWHVLVHYTDDQSHDPDQTSWDDKVWVFEPSGSRLRWTEYPIVVFEDQTGRFERLGGARAARVLHGWEPNEAQSAQIRTGLEVNDRGSKSKTLSKHGDDWRSATRPSAASASIVTYVENWSVEGAAGKPVFRREDVLGSGLTEGLEGLTEYATTEVSRGGDVLRGTFERDGIRHGTFRLRRAGEVRGVEGRAKSEGQRFYQRYLEGFGEALAKDDGAFAKARAHRAKEDGELPEDLRERAEAGIRAAIGQSIRDAGADPRDFEREVDSLTRTIAELLLDQGRSLEEVEQLLSDGKINP
jgi:hypothetical protein